MHVSEKKLNARKTWTMNEVNTTRPSTFQRRKRHVVRESTFYAREETNMEEEQHDFKRGNNNFTICGEKN